MMKRQILMAVFLLSCFSQAQADLCKAFSSTQYASRDPKSTAVVTQFKEADQDYVISMLSRKKTLPVLFKDTPGSQPRMRWIKADPENLKFFLRDYQSGPYLFDIPTSGIRPTKIEYPLSKTFATYRLSKVWRENKEEVDKTIAQMLRFLRSDQFTFCRIDYNATHLSDYYSNPPISRNPKAWDQ